MIPTHVLPEVWSDQRQHVLDDGRCWCRPMVEVIAGCYTITHRPEQLSGTVNLGS